MVVVEVPKLGKEAATKAIKEWGQSKSKITHVVFCTTSGVDMPGADYQLTKLLGLRPLVKRLMMYQQEEDKPDNYRLKAQGADKSFHKVSDSVLEEEGTSLSSRSRSEGRKSLNVEVPDCSLRSTLQAFLKQKEERSMRKDLEQLKKSYVDELEKTIKANLLIGDQERREVELRKEAEGPSPTESNPEGSEDLEKPLESNPEDKEEKKRKKKLRKGAERTYAFEKRMGVGYKGPEEEAIHQLMRMEEER
ncbi:hypothetical protein QQ045_025084 [Rhodiola kirilowii]